MPRYARIADDQVLEIFEPPQGLSIEDCFHPDIAESFVACGNEVLAGWLYEDAMFAPPPGRAAPDLDTIKAARIQILSADCAATITGGYLSTALGNPHAYPSGITDQINMMGSVTSSLLPGAQSEWSTPFWCGDAEGIWAFRLHTAAQIQQAGADGKGHVVTCQALLEALNAQVMAASTADEVEVITWFLE